MKQLFSQEKPFKYVKKKMSFKGVKLLTAGGTLILLFSKQINNVIVKTLIMLQNISVSNKCCSFELSSKSSEKMFPGLQKHVNNW